MQPDNFKQVFIINKDLKMTCGKICAQVLHGEVLYIEDVFNSETESFLETSRPELLEKHKKLYNNYNNWRDETNITIEIMKKVILTGKYLQRELGSMFDVTRANIGSIVRNKIWKVIK